MDHAATFSNFYNPSDTHRLRFGLCRCGIVGGGKTFSALRLGGAVLALVYADH